MIKDITQTSKEVLAGLMQLANANGGRLSPYAVVDAARSEESIFHGFFEWDDTIAAENHRLWQARQLISVQVHYLPREDETVRVFASVQSDRDHSGGASYRPLNVIMSNPELRSELIEQCKRDARRFTLKYQQLHQVADIIAAIRKFI